MKVFIGAVTILSLAYGVVSEKPACEGNEFHPNPIDHHSYYQCHNGILEQIYCLDGLYYNHVEKQCTGTRPDDDRFPPPPTMPPWWPSGWPTFPTAWPTWPSKPTTDPISTTIKEDEPTDPPCTGYDKYPYPYDCSKYYQCVDGSALWLNDCPVPLHFNEARNECDWEEAANCIVSTTTDDPTTTTEEPTTPTEDPTTTTEEPTTTTEEPTTTTEEPTTTTEEPTTTTEEPTTTTEEPTTTTEEPTTTTEEPTTTTEEPTTTTEEPTTTTEEPTTTTEEPTTTTEEPTTTTEEPTTTTEEPTTTTEEPTTTTPKVTTPTTPKPGVINCANGEYQPHPTDCTKYYHCSNGTPYLRPCPAGLHFNRILNVCDWPKDAGCESGSGGTPPAPTTKPPPSGGVTCEVGDTFKPHESDCTKFYSCWTGEAIEQICPSGLHWNQAKKVCDFPADAGCEVTPKPTEGTTTAKPVPTTAKPPSSGEIDCGKGMYHAHPSDCTKFYQCSNGVPHMHHCPSGLHFNPSINVCDWPNAAGCKS